MPPCIWTFLSSLGKHAFFGIYPKAVKCIKTLASGLAGIR